MSTLKNNNLFKNFEVSDAAECECAMAGHIVEALEFVDTNTLRSLYISMFGKDELVKKLDIATGDYDPFNH